MLRNRETLVSETQILRSRQTVGTSPAMRAPALPVVTGPGGKHRTVRYSGSGEKGYSSEWSASMDFFTDPKWDRLASDR